MSTSLIIYITFEGFDNMMTYNYANARFKPIELYYKGDKS